MTRKTPSSKSGGPEEPSPAGSGGLHSELKHYPQSVLKWVGDKNWMSGSQVSLSVSSTPKDVILFVHGWGGDAGSTWESFPAFTCSMPELSNADVFFLEFPTLQSQVSFCAAQFRGFLNDLVCSPASRVLNPSLPTNAPPRADMFSHQRIVIVAHSMGAVVARRAILDLDQSLVSSLSDAELARFRLLFFAPAHSGSTIPLLIGSGFGLDFLPGAKLIGSLARMWFQSLRDLEEGSPFLQKLADDCKRTRESRVGRNASIEHVRATVYHAQNDRVVSQNDFDNDPPFHPVMEQNHRTICKPNQTYLDPIEAFRAIISG